jgi:NADH-quinone oxidoreductase subunit A
MTTAIFTFIIASACLAGLVLVLVLVLGTDHPSSEKLSAYECGFEPFGDARQSFDVSFYLVGLMFLIFDVEIAFLFP